jgi:arginyl-tRNA synthetase
MNELLRKVVVKILKDAGIECKESDIEMPPQPSFGDLSFPCFGLAKIQKKNPQHIAVEIAQKITVPKDSLVKSIEATGGYVNFFFSWEKIAGTLLKEIIAKKGEYSFAVKKKKVMIEFSQPNTNKPMHIGHARNTMIGDSLSRILEFVGHKVVRANYLGDIGLHVAKSMVGYMKWGSNKQPDKKSDHFVGDFYVRFSNESKSNPALEEEARELLRKWESGDKATIVLWKKMKEWCLKGFKETYKKLDVDFDVWFYESQFEKSGKEIVSKLLEKGIAFKTPEGAVVADLEKYGLPSYIILRSDGTSLYGTKDFQLGIEKFEKYKIDESIYVVGNEQKTYLSQTFKVLELFGYEKAKQCYHLAYGLVMLPEGKMSSREGKVVLLDGLLEELEQLAKGVVSKANPNMDEVAKKKIAEQVAVASLKHALLKVSPEKNIIFDKNEVVQFEGDTGPYIQYAHTRCCSILEKAGKWKPSFNQEKVTEEEKELVKKLIQFPAAVEEAAKDLRPHYMCNYAYELATVFNTFYHACPVLRAEEKEFRLALVKAAKITIGKSLELLGIVPLEKM